MKDSISWELHYDYNILIFTNKKNDFYEKIGIDILDQYNCDIIYANDIVPIHESFQFMYFKSEIEFYDEDEMNRFIMEKL